MIRELRFLEHDHPELIGVLHVHKAGLGLKLRYSGLNAFCVILGMGPKDLVFRDPSTGGQRGKGMTTTVMTQQDTEMELAGWRTVGPRGGGVEGMS